MAAPSDLSPCPYENEREFPVELRKIRRIDELTKRTDGEKEYNGLLNDLKSAATSSQLKAMLKLEPSELLSKLDDQDSSIQADALEAIKKILVKGGSESQSLEIFLKGDLIAKCINLIRYTEIPIVAHEALLILHFISYGDTNLTKSLLHSEAALPLLLDLLKTNLNLAEKAALTLGNIAADSIYCRNVLFDNGIVQALEELSSQYLPNGFRRNFAWLLANLCRSKGLSHKFSEAKRLLPLIKKIIKESKDEETWMHCCIAVHRLTFDCDTEKIQAVVDNGMIPPLIRLVNIGYEKTLAMSLKAIGNISSGTAEQSSSLIAGKLLPKLTTLLQYDNKETMKLALWILGNICADNSKHIQAVIDAEAFSFLYPILADGSPDLQFEAAATVKNVIKNGTEKQINDVIHNNNLLGPFCRLLNSSNINTIKVVICGLSDLLLRAEAKKYSVKLCASIETIGVVDKIDALQYHENTEIQENATLLVDRFFSKHE